MKLENIQAMRAFAALAVAVAHLESISGQPWLDAWVGGAGVSLFFILSGFLMARICDTSAPGPSSAVRFWWRRLLRVAPLYYIVTLLVLIGIVVSGERMHSAADPAKPLKALITSILFVKPVVAVAWTLTYEMLFYTLIAAYVAVKGTRWGKPYLWLLVGLGPVVELLIRMWWSDHWDPTDHRSMLLLFSLGVVAHGWRPSPTWSPLAASLALCLGGVGLFYVAGDRTISNGHLPWTAFTVSLFGFFLWSEGWLSFPPWLARLGDASYSLYLVHLYIIYALWNGLWLPMAWGASPVGFVAFCAVALFVACLFSLGVYKWVEAPLNRAIATRWAHLTNG